jgi:hypothetical protein
MFASACESCRGSRIKRVLYDSLLKEVQRRGASIPAAHALLERVLRSLGSRTGWSKMARSQTNSLSNEKKVFFADPLLHTIALEHAPGLRADIPALIENAVGLALYRRYEPPERLIESFISPDRLHAWRTARAGEVDFVAGPRRELDVVEVKYQRQIDLRGHSNSPVAVGTRVGAMVSLAEWSVLGNHRTSGP